MQQLYNIDCVLVSRYYLIILIVTRNDTIVYWRHGKHANWRLLHVSRGGAYLNTIILYCITLIHKHSTCSYCGIFSKNTFYHSSEHNKV